MRQVIEWLGNEPLPVYVNDVPNAFCIYSRSKSNDYSIVVLTGLNSDTFDSFTLDVSGEWVDSSVQFLNDKGIWESIKISKQNRSFKIEKELSLMNPVILRLEND
jgi:hypothetical protein